MTINYFGKQLKPFFNKNHCGTKFKLVKGDEILNENEKITQKLNKFLQDTVSNLNVQTKSVIHGKMYHNLSDHVQIPITKYKHHILLIQGKISSRHKFLFLVNDAIINGKFLDSLKLTY